MRGGLKRKVMSEEHRQRAIILGGIKGIGLSALIAWLFYRDIRGLLVLPVCVWISCKKEKQADTERRQEKIQQQFAEFLGFLEEALTAGYSLEKAVGEAGRGMVTAYGEDFFTDAVGMLQKRISLGKTVEEAFAEFAGRIRCDEAEDFSEVLYIAKRTGGAVRQVIVNTEGILLRKQETLRQVRGTLHSRMYENNLMKYMPFAMLLYLQIGMPDFLRPLYHNLAGVALMTGILGCYAGLCVAMDKISQITV